MICSPPKKAVLMPQREKVLEIPLSELHPFKDHPFKVKDDEAMMETADSVRQYGVVGSGDCPTGPGGRL